MRSSDRKEALSVCAGLIGLFALQQAPFILRGDYSRRLVWEGTSPGQRFRLEISRQATFPAYDILDPEGKAYFRVTDNQTGRIIVATEARVWEIADVEKAQVKWTTSYAEVTEFGGKSTPSVRLSLPQ